MARLIQQTTEGWCVFDTRAEKILSGPHETEEEAEGDVADGPPTVRRDEATGWNKAVECITEAFCSVAPYLRDGDEPQDGAPADNLGAMLLVMLEDSIEGEMTRGHVVGARDLVQAIAYVLDRFDPQAPRGAEMAVTSGEEGSA